MAPRDSDAVDGADEKMDGKATSKTPDNGVGGTGAGRRAADSQLVEPSNASSVTPWRRYAIIGLISALGPLVALIVGLYIYLAGGRYIATDNAYVKSDKIVISSDVAGRVVNVAVRDNQIVEPGQVLFQVDPAPFEMAFARADAQLAAARQSVAALRAIYKQRLASLARAKGEVEFHTEQLDRQKALSRRNLVSGLNLDTAMRNLRDGEYQIKVAEQELAEALAKLGGDPDIPVDDHPAVREAQVLRDEAALNKERTVVRATLHGAVTNFDLHPGEYVRPGAAVFSLVGATNNWVHANYKETELTHVQVGQPATITIDTYPGIKFAATVEGIAPATGAEFAVLPPQNATGNWVKVVQRLTVRLKLNDQNLQKSGATLPRLRAGMSAHVEIDTGHQRELTGIFGTVAECVTGVTKDRS